MALGPLALLVLVALLVGVVILIGALGRRRSRAPNPAEQERIEKMLRK